MDYLQHCTVIVHLELQKYEAGPTRAVICHCSDAFGSRQLLSMLGLLTCLVVDLVTFFGLIELEFGSIFFLFFPSSPSIFELSREAGAKVISQVFGGAFICSER